MRAAAEFLQQIVSGTAAGCVYALVAIGFVLIYKATEVVNFAQGELMMLGAFLGYTFVSIFGLPFWLGILLAATGMAVVGGAIEAVAVRPVVGHPVFSIVMVTFGIGFVARSVAGLVPGWGTDILVLRTPFAGKVVSAGSIVVSQDHVAIIVATLLLMTGLYWFFRKSRIGLALQATSQNQLAAYFVGIPVRSMFTVIWAMSAAVAAVAGVLLAPIAFVHVNMGFIGLKAFPAAVLGGFGSIPGAVVGGWVIGVVEALAGFYLPEGIKDVAAYIVLLAVLAIRPQGLFGQAERKKV